MKRLTLLFPLTIFMFIGLANANSIEINSMEINESNSATSVIQKDGVKIYYIIKNINDKDDKYDKPVPCVVIIEDDEGNQYTGYGEGFSVDSACRAAYQDAMNQMEK